MDLVPHHDPDAVFASHGSHLSTDAFFLGPFGSSSSIGTYPWDGSGQDDWCEAPVPDKVALSLTPAPRLQYQHCRGPVQAQPR